MFSLSFTSRFLFVVILMTSMMVYFISTPCAQLLDTYTINGVEVDKTAKSAAAARRLALAEGRQLAFLRLIERLVPKKEHQNVQKPKIEPLERMISGVQIESEKNSQVRYIASLNIEFVASEVRRYLRGAGVGFAETFSKPILVLPILRRESGDVLWSEMNEWHEAWKKLPKSYSLTPFKIPDADPLLSGLINADQALNGEQSRINAIASYFGTKGVLLAVATVKQDRLSSENIVELVVSRFRTGISDNTEVRSLRTPISTPMSSFFASAAKRIRDDFSETWKINNQIRFADRDTIYVTVEFDSLLEWIDIRTKLEAVAALEQIDVTRISLDKVLLRLSYFGSPDQLSMGLSQKNLELKQNNGNWAITSVSGVVPN